MPLAGYRHRKFSMDILHRQNTPHQFPVFSSELLGELGKQAPEINR